MTSVGAWMHGSRETVSWYTVAHRCAFAPQAEAMEGEIGEQFPHALWLLAAK
jgi:hypothetical protein